MSWRYIRFGDGLSQDVPTASRGLFPSADAAICRVPGQAALVERTVDGSSAWSDPGRLRISRSEGIRHRDLAARSARALSEIFRPGNRGRGECRVPNAPAALCALWVVSMHTGIHSGGTGKHSAFPTQWFCGLLRALPGDHRFVDPVIRATRWRPRELDSCFGAQEPRNSALLRRRGRQRGHLTSSRDIVEPSSQVYANSII
jgi:hypothetical protein